MIYPDLVYTESYIWDYGMVGEYDFYLLLGGKGSQKLWAIIYFVSEKIVRPFRLDKVNVLSERRFRVTFKQCGVNESTYKRTAGMCMYAHETNKMLNRSNSIATKCVSFSFL